MLTLINTLALVLATWRLSHMLVHEQAPFRLAWRLRRVFGADKSRCAEQVMGDKITNVFCCTWCMSVWVAALLFGISWHPVGGAVVYILALSGAALVVDRMME